MISTSQVIDNARSWLGVRFLHQGRSRHGVDCLGFIAAVLDELGSDVFMRYLPRAYGRDPQSLLIDRLSALSRQIPLQPGALALIKWPASEHPSHAAIYTGSTLIHCFQSEGRVIEHGYRGPWVARTMSVWALPLVVYQ
jgi:cell wall-associated NlpC family hydrolase